MTHDVSTNPISKRFNEINGMFFAEKSVWVKIPEVLDKNKIDKYNAYCFDNNSLSYFRYDTLVTDPTNVNMKVKF